MQQRFSLVIFDCDGVLVDSETIANRVFAALLAEHGVRVSPAVLAEQLTGRATGDCVRWAHESLGARLPPDFQVRYERRSRAALAREVRPVAGVPAMLEALTLPVAIASNGSRDKVALTLAATGLLARFADRWFGIEDVANRKPAPDIYLHAAQACGVAPADCLVVEDSVPGVAAGRTAGMTVFGFAAPAGAAALRAAGAHRLFDDMRQLPALVEAAAVAESFHPEALR